MPAPGSTRAKRWLYDTIFAVHGVVAVWNVLMGFGHGLRLLAPAAAEWLGALVMIATLGMWIPALWASPVIIVVSFYYWRDWSVLSLALLLAGYVATLQDVESTGFAAMAAIYTPFALFLCLHWFFRRRRTW